MGRHPWMLLTTALLMILTIVDGRVLHKGRVRSASRWYTLSSSPRFTLLGPDLLRADSPENIYLQADEVSDPVSVSIIVQDYAKTTLHQTSVTLDAANGFSALTTIQISSDTLNRDERKNKLVYLKANFEGHHTIESEIMVTFHKGFIFIQTDKPIYNPGDSVWFRAFVSSPSFKAQDDSITIDIENPDGVVVRQISRSRSSGGILSDTFPLSEMVNEGKWTVTAKFDHWKQNTFKAHFEVKKYVLPAFNVTLTPRKSFLKLDDDSLEVEISARYLYGEPVQGTAYVVFGVKINKEMRRLPDVKQVSDLSGGVVKLSVEELKRAYPDYKTLVGNSIYVKASVLTNTGSDLVEAEKSGIKIVESPYVVTFKDMSPSYKTGLPFDFSIVVSHHDGSPANNVPLKVNLLPEPLVAYSGVARASLSMPTYLRAETISAETMDPGLKPEQQAKSSITVEPYFSYDVGKQNYLHISTDTTSVSVGEMMSLKLVVSVGDPTQRHAVKHVTYLVMNKGTIISAKRVSVVGQQHASVGLMVTPDMMPSFRMVAFYSIPWQRREEVVSDSIWVDVAGSCVGDLKVEPVDGRHRDYMPGKAFSFKVRGDPGAKVTFAAVDNAVYLLNRDRLTQRKIWGIVGDGDIGCTKGGGRDARQVFTNAGVHFSSSTSFKTQSRRVLQCPANPRRRRSADLLKRKVELENHYKEKLLHRCCTDGLREIRMPYSCTRRSLYITEGWECIRAFRYCCASYRDQVFDTEMPPTVPPTTPAPTTTRPTIPIRRFGSVDVSARRIMLTSSMFSWSAVSEPKVNVQTYTNVFKAAEEQEVVERSQVAEVEQDNGWEDEDDYADETEVYRRFKFFESWLWTDTLLPTEAEQDGLASKKIEHPLPDSITEWGILAISASPQTGFCVAQPYNVKAWKSFFVDLKLPYSVARNEQVEIKAVIHNYRETDLHVRVVLMKTEGMCSVAFKDKHTQELALPAGSSKVVLYTIVPLVVGSLPIEVMVLARDLMGSDRIQKPLKVVMDGVQKTAVWSVVLNPAAVGGTQTVRMGKIELKSLVPHSIPETFINVRGNVLADSIDNSINEDSLASLIRMPGGCVEQNLATMTLPLIATLYLERTSGWQSVGVERKAQALQYIRRGYEKQLSYKKKEGSYPPYRREGASTWITAYVVKVFSMAHSIIGVNEQQVCDPLMYLVKNKHRLPQGKFVENNPVYSTTMTGGMRGDDPEITLTAFVLIALAEAQQAGIRCSDSETQAVLQKTTEYLKRAVAVPSRRPYTVAIVSYALALVKDTAQFDPTVHLLKASEGGSHWPDRTSRWISQEGTGYALLALVKLGKLKQAMAPFNWLNSQRSLGGGFGPTQSTMVVLHALSEYLIHQPSEDSTLNVDLRMPGRKDVRYHFNPKTAYAARSSRLPANLALDVVAQGNGEGILEVVTYYNQMPQEAENCPHFDLSVNIEESSEKPPADVEKSFMLTIKVRASQLQDVRMVVLDISLPTGFTPENSDLEMLSNSVDRYISNFQIVDNLSDRGSLIIHLFKVSHSEPDILMFRLQQRFRVGLLQPSSVTVYEYYNPDRRCSQTYTPPENQEALSRICQDNVCRCTQGDCCISKSNTAVISSAERVFFACKSLHHVLQVQVLNVSQSYYDKYEVSVTEVIKLGVEAGVEMGQRRVFMSHGGCREGLNLKVGSKYLIMGPAEDQWSVDGATNRFIYMLGKDTWVEHWPTDSECSSDATLRNICLNLQETASELLLFGCRV
ncbi:complement C3-like isoform X2 [Synchiropus splendidus]|uniref:complement C3-like isoform X2 n=1 Tax=Synchiropus splendidus TaxID=270530 RepID=UPI00237D8ED1|nr:complement C3-like isoform X2 [Synchiropus splendidus]